MENENKKSKGANPTAIISYIGPLCLIPYLNKDKDEFVQFHARQGLVLFICEVITWAIAWILPFLWTLMNLLSLVWLVFAVIGILNVVHKEKKELPIIGSFAGKIK